MTAALHFANPLSSDTIRMTGVDDGNNHGVCVGNNLPTNTIIGNGNIGDGNFLSPSAIEDEMLVKPADGSCADGDDTAKNTSSDEDEDENDDDDDFEIVSLEEERPPALHTAATPISEEPRATSPRLQEEQNDRCREHHASLPSPSPSTKPLALFDSISKSIPRPQTHSEIVASPTQTTYHHHQRSLRPLLLQVPPYTPLLIDVAATFPVVAHIHPSSPLRDHVRLGDVLVYIDGKNSVQWSFEALTRRLNSDAFGADGVERKQIKKKREKEKMRSEEGNGEDAEEEKEEKAPEEAGYRTLIVLPKEQFRQRPRSSGRRSRKKTCRKKDRENIGLVTPAKDRHLDEIAPCIATPTTTTTTTTTNTTSISTAPIAAMTAIATTNDATPDDENDDDIENPHGQDPTTIAKQTNVVVVAPPPLPSATADNIATDDENKTHFQTKTTSAEEDNAATTSQNRVSMSEVGSVRNSRELSNPMAVTEGNGNGLGEEGRRDDDEIDDEEEDEEEEVEIIDEKIRHDVHIPTTAPPPATNKPSTPPEQRDEEEREYENLRKLVLRLQSQASPLSPHQRRIYEESYELLKERDRELRRNRPPVDIDVIAIRRRGDGCVSLKIRDRDDDNDNEDGEEEFSVEEVSTLYGGKWNPALYSASPRRLEDVWGYDVEEGYDCGGFHHLHRHHHHHHGNRYLTLAQGDATAHDTAPISPSHHHNTHAKHHRLDIPHPNILGLLHPAAHRYRFDADARDALLQQQDDQVRRMALESLKRRQKRVEGFFVSLMFASVGALIVILVMVFWAKD